MSRPRVVDPLTPMASQYAVQGFGKQSLARTRMEMHESDRGISAYGLELLKEEHANNLEERANTPSPPSSTAFLEIAKRSYRTTAGASVEGFVLKVNTATVDCWVNENEKKVIISVRGTVGNDLKDLYADANLVVNRLTKTSRYIQDKAIVERLLERYSPHVYAVYLTGHSLGGAIVTQLMRDFPAIKGAETFNSAFQLNDLVDQGRGIKRRYTSTDPLYLAGGKHFDNTEVHITNNEFGHKLHNFD